MHRHLNLVAALGLTTFLAVTSGARAAEQPEPPRVLLLNSYAMGHTWTEDEVAGFISAFRKVHPHFRPHVEFMDWKKYPEPENLERLRDLISYKYAKNQVDAIVATDNAALDFALEHREEIASGKPLVFCGINGFRPEMVAGLTRITGVAEQLDVRGTLELMLTMHPRTRLILVAGEASEIGAMVGREVDRAAASLGSAVEVRHANASSFDELLVQVDRLPEDSLVLIDSMTRDATGRVFRSELAAREISERSPVPVYGFWDFQLGNGILGGRLLSGWRQGELAAELTLQALRGEFPDAVLAPPGRLMFDYAQLSRFGIEDSAVPEGAVVANAPAPMRLDWEWLAGALSIAAILAASNVALLANIRRRRRAERSLRERKRLFRALAEHGSDLIVTLHSDRRIDYRSPAFASFLGHPLEGDLPAPKDGLVHPEDRAVFEAAFVEATRAPGTAARGRMRLRRSDGQWRAVEFVLHNLLDDPAVGRYIATGWDVTDRLEAEAERARLLEREQAARRQAEEANRSKDEFLALISHELRTPLTPILGWVHVLKAGHVDPDTAQKALDVIDRNAHAQARLIEDLLDLSGIVSGKLRLARRATDLLPIVAGVIDSLEKAAAEKQISIERQFELKAARLDADPDRLQQVAWNLLANAIKFTPRRGHVQVRLREHGGRIELAVRDDGEGLSAEQLTRVFGRFWQADSTCTRRFGGLGLGLAIVRHLVEGHGGEVRAESPGLGKGSTFMVLLPGAAGAPAKVHPATAAAREFSGLKVLVVEDEPDNRELLVQVLVRRGAQVAQADSASRALEELESFAPDLLLSDIGLPGQDGYALIRAVRTRGAGVPAIALTAHAGKNHRDEALAAGFQLHLAKPVDPDDLVRAIASLVGKDASTHG